MSRSLQLQEVLIAPRSACFEISNGQCYRSREEHLALLAGAAVWRGKENVFTLTDLQPGTRYELLVRSGGEERRLHFSTPPEAGTLDPRAFGGKGDGQTDETQALQRAIDACPEGGRVLVPEGTWLTAPLFLKSNMDLHLARGARLLGHPEVDKWPVLPAMRDGQVLATWEGEPGPSHAGLITGIDVENVRIYGAGVIDGNASHKTWWSRPKSMFTGWRARTVHLIRSKNIAIEGVTLCNSPSWTLHPYRCQKLTVARIKVEAPIPSPNTDGINPECCEDVRIAGVHISTGDDCIAIKSGKIALAKLGPVPTRRVRISNSLMENGHGAIVIGSEMAGGVYDVEARDCLFLGTDRGLRLKTRRGRGKDAIIDGIHLKNVQMDKVGTPFVINSFYWCDPDGKQPHVGDRKPYPVDAGTPSVRNVSLDGVACTQVQHSAGYVLGLPEQPPENISVRNYRVAFDPQAEPGMPDMAEGIVAVAREGFRVLNARGLELENIELQGVEGPAFIQENVIKQNVQGERRVAVPGQLEARTAWLGEVFAAFTRGYLARWKQFKPGWVYEDGIIFKGLLDLSHATGERELSDFVHRVVSPRVAEDGTIEGYERKEFNIDHICAGKIFFPLLESTGEARYRRAIEHQASQLAAHPRTRSGNYWHKQIYPNQVWLDGLYMGQPFQLAYAALEGRADLAADTVRQFEHVQRVLRDARTGLYYHGWDESRQMPWANPETGCSPCFWGRAMGWFLMALVDCLDFESALGSEGTRSLAGILQDASEALLRVRSEAGLWYQVLDRGPERGNYEEASGSLMIAYALMKGQRLGVLPAATGERGRESLVAAVRRFLTPAQLGGICGVAGLGGTPYRDGTFEYYMSEAIVPDDPKGVCALFMAASEAVLRQPG